VWDLWVAVFGLMSVAEGVWLNVFFRGFLNSLARSQFLIAYRWELITSMSSITKRKDSDYIILNISLNFTRNQEEMLIDARNHGSLPLP
jgi:hypothetical protein